MSTDANRDGRDRAAELASPKAGQTGIPVDALCVGCGQIRVKRARPDEIDQPAAGDPTTLEATDLTSFTHVCHRCGSVQWWNPVAVLTGLIDAERSAGE